jgi:DNA polymerase III psi subunit
MELSMADIQLLYGPTLWLAEARLAQAPTQPAKAPAQPIAAASPAPMPEPSVAEASPETAPAAKAPEPVASLEPATPAGSTWRYQPEAVLAVVVPAPHLEDPTLLELLHKMCGAVQVPPQRLNVLAAPFVQDHQLLDARTRFVLIFGQEIYPSANETCSMQGIEIYRLPYLAQLLHDTAAKRHAWELMKQFKDRIYE